MRPSAISGGASTASDVGPVSDVPLDHYHLSGFDLVRKFKLLFFLVGSLYHCHGFDSLWNFDVVVFKKRIPYHLNGCDSRWKMWWSSVLFLRLGWVPSATGKILIQIHLKIHPILRIFFRKRIGHLQLGLFMTNRPGGLGDITSASPLRSPLLLVIKSPFKMFFDVSI